METKICKDCGRELPIENFKKTWKGTRVNTCTECATKKLRENKKKKLLELEQKGLEQARINNEAKKALAAFTSRQLMEELARRGYKGQLEYTRIEKIDITNF